jgi:hypothetical protein
VWPHLIARWGPSPPAWRQPAPERFVDDLLDRLSLPMRLLLEQPSDIRLERQGGPHEDIMMPGPPAFNPHRSLTRHGTARVSGKCRCRCSARPHEHRWAATEPWRPSCASSGLAACPLSPMLFGQGPAPRTSLTLSPRPVRGRGEGKHAVLTRRQWKVAKRSEAEGFPRRGVEVLLLAVCGEDAKDSTSASARSARKVASPSREPFCLAERSGHLT